MSGQKRGSLEVTMDVLLVIEDHERQTRIQYVANIDYLKVRTILENLIDRGFIIEDMVRTRRLYHLTEKGRELLDRIKIVKRQLKDIWTSPDKGISDKTPR